MNLHETMFMKNTPLNLSKKELKKIIAQFDLSEEPVIKGWCYNFNHPVYVLENYVLIKTNFGNKEGSLIERVKEFVWYNKNIAKHIKIPKYFKLKQGGYWLRDGANVWLVRARINKWDLQELIAGFFLSGTESFDEYLIKVLSLDKNKMQEHGLLKKDFAANLIGQALANLHNNTFLSIKDSYLPLHEARLRKVFSNESVDYFMSRHNQGPVCLCVFDPRLRNIVIENDDGLPTIVFIDTDSARLANPEVDVSSFGSESLKYELLRIFNNHYSDRIKSFAESFNKSFLVGYGPTINCTPYPILNKLLLSNVTCETYDPNKLEIIKKPFLSLMV